MKPFHIECQQMSDERNGIVEVCITGFLDAHTVATFERTMEELLDQDNNRIIIDLSGLSYISSAGIGALMVLLQQLRRRGGDMVIVQPSPKVYKIFDLLGFTRIFQIRESREAAHQQLG